MATIATTTNATPFIYPGTTLLDRMTNPNPGIGSDGYLYCLVKASTADNYTIYRSTDGGTSWGSLATFVRTGIVELGSLIVHHGGHIWITYRVNESNTDKIYVRRLYVPTATFEGEFLIASAGNGGSAGAVYNGGIDLHPVGLSNQWTVLMATGYTSGAQHGVQLHCFTWSYTPGTTPVVNNGLLVGGRQYLYTGSGRISPSLDLEHNGGGGKGSTNPSMWLAFGRTQLHCARLAWNGSGWNLQNTTVVFNSSIGAQNYVCGRFDGTRFMAGAMVNDTVIVYERNKANSTTTPRTTPSHTTGNVRNYALSYNSVSGDLRVFAVGTSTTVLYYIDFIRQSSSWTSWATVSGSSILGTTGDNFGVRRGTYGTTKYDTYYAVSGAPNTLTHTQQTLSYAPNTPTWNFGSVPYQNGSAADVAASLLLDWDFTDPDPVDAQSAWALQRQIGIDPVEYWRVSDGTWQPTEIKNTSGTTQVTLPTGFVDRFDTGVAGWTPNSATFAASAVARSDTSSGLLTTTGTPSQAYVRTPNLPVSPSTSYALSLWEKVVAGYSAVGASIDWFNSTPTYLSTSASAQTATAANVWENRSVTATSPGTAAFAQVGPTIGANPPAGTALYLDDVTFGATPTPWAAASDQNHIYKVKVWDSADTASAYSAGLVLIPSAKVNPTITAPTAAQVIGVDHVTATWTVSEQTQFRVRLSGSGTYDSGWVTSSALTFTPPYMLANGTSWTLTLNTKNAEGLASSDVTVNFTVAYVQPPAPTTVATALPASGIIRVVITNPAVVGSQPALATVDLWRRIVGAYSTIVNSNPTVEVNLNDWTAAGSSIARDSAFAHDGTWSIKVTPNGSSLACYAESGKYAITQGVAMTATAWIRPVTGNKNTAIYLHWYTSGDVYISSSKLLASPVAGAWIFMQLTAAPVPTAAKVSIAAGIEGATAPAGTDIVYCDEVELTLADTTTPVRIATGLGSGATVDDWQAVSGISYEYRASTVGVNGSSVDGPWMP